MASDGMGRGERTSGAWAVPSAAVVLVLVVGLFLWGRGDLNGLICDGDCGPEYVTAPHGLTPGTVPVLATAVPAEPGSVDRIKLAAAVGPALGAKPLGSHVGFAAIDPVDGSELVAVGDGAFIPASTTKLLVGFAALRKLDPQTRFTTRVVRAGDRIVLVGGGDPYLAVKLPKKPDHAIRADLTTLARGTAEALKQAGVTTVVLGYDDSLFSGPAVSPGWESTYVPDNVVTPVSALWADQGVRHGVRSASPATSAAGIFADLLHDRGITVTGEPTRVEAPKSAPLVAEVHGATVAQIVETLLRTSDNQAAEVMLRHVGLASGGPGSFKGGIAAVTDALRSAGIDTTGLVLTDGSGLARKNRITPRTLVQTIGAAATAPRTSALVADLPVGGFSGTLLRRFTATTAGAVRAKTGTLTGVHSLAGYAVDAQGHPVIFAVMVDHTASIAGTATQDALDRVAAAIAGCSCGT